MTSRPRKATGELASKVGRKLITSAEYFLLRFFAKIFGAAFWFVEQRSYDLAERLDERSEK